MQLTWDDLENILSLAVARANANYDEDAVRAIGYISDAWANEYASKSERLSEQRAGEDY